MKKFQPHTRLWLEKDKKSILGDGKAELLRKLLEVESLKLASEELSISYKHAWLMIREIEKALGKKIVTSRRGGREWGFTKLTEEGKKLLREYDDYLKILKETIHDKTFWEVVSLKISARNLLKGRVKEIEKGDVTAKVTLKIEKAELKAV
ncbi:MAG: molybdenum-dependent transcriptional regulator [Candidatus Methanofastidiosia archaeon]